MNDVPSSGLRAQRRHRKFHRIGDTSQWSCFYCGQILQCRRCNPGTTSAATRDHIIPVSRGGANVYKNLLLACERCNRSKGSTDIATFVGGGVPPDRQLTHRIGDSWTLANVRHAVPRGKAKKVMT